MLRNLLGPNSSASIPITNFSKDFMLTPLMKANAVICDENDVGGYLENAGNFKLAVTKDPMRINIKNKEPKDVIFKGLMVQCVNDVPRVRDKTSSFYRRLLTIPMNKKFEGVERKYIKQDYMYRKDVLEYVLKKALMGDFYELSIPRCSLDLKNEIREINDPVRQFIEDVFFDLTWDLLPNTFLYDCYKSWFKENVGESGKHLSSRSFVRDLRNIIENDYPDWVYSENRISGTGRMEEPEPFIVKYNLKDWMNPNYKGSDKDILAKPLLDTRGYRGFLKSDVV